MVTLLYGDEPQLIEEQKKKIFKEYKDLPVVIMHDHISPIQIGSKLNEDSLFGEKRVFCFVNLPIFKKANKKVSPEWENVQKELLHYNGENPVVLIHHDHIDKRIAYNKEFLEAVTSYEFKKVGNDEIIPWISSYGKEHGYKIDESGRAYLGELLSLWDNVPLMFLRTEMDRLFLLVSDTKTITADVLREHMSDFGAKNIFAFKDALLHKNTQVLGELIPFILHPKQMDRAFSYIEGQLRLQLMVNECAAYGMNLKETQDYIMKRSDAYKAYPIKLAFQGRPKITMKALANFLCDLCIIVQDHRSGKGSTERFKDICFAYCYSKDT